MENSNPGDLRQIIKAIHSVGRGQGNTTAACGRSTVDKPLVVFATTDQARSAARLHGVEACSLERLQFKNQGRRGPVVFDATAAQALANILQVFQEVLTKPRA